jgi:hypothetical protein
MLSLRIGQPADVLLVRFGNSWVEHAILDGMNLIDALWGSAGRFKFRDRNLDIDGADLVGPCVLRE